jgi:hypothetical protein
MKVNRPLFTLTLRPEPGVDPINALRRVLKVLLRQYGMRCTSVDQIETNEEESTK